MPWQDVSKGIGQKVLRMGCSMHKSLKGLWCKARSGVHLKH